MKYVIGLLLGALIGALLGLLIVLNNPFAGADDSKTPPQSDLRLPVAGQGTALVMQAGSGYPWVRTQPADASAPKIEGMRSAVSVMLSTANDSRTVAYIARVRALTGAGKPLLGEVREESFWHVVVPGSGSFAVFSQDNIWPLVSELAVPFALGDSWAGDVRFRSTTGPAGNAAEVIGISGDYLSHSGSASLFQQVHTATASVGITDEKATLYVQMKGPELAEAASVGGPETLGVLQ